jgi:tRNA(Ile)-lysidine synthetase-like protein
VVGAEYGNLIFSGPEKRPHSEEQIVESTEVEVPGQTRFDRNLVKATVLDASAFAEATADKRCSMLDTRKKTKSRIENRESRIQFVERFDFDKIKPPLVVRFRRPGDRFVPLGLGEEKKVGKFLTAAQIPQEVRQKLLIVADSEKIIWVWPIRIAEQAKVTSGTRKILQLQITDMPMQAK